MSLRRKGVLLVICGLVLTVPAYALAPVLHEYIEPNPSEDLELRATTQDGAMPAVIETPSGVVAAPRPRKSPSPSGVAYGGPATPDSIDASYRIDRDTTRPETVRYDDPFIPAVTPFKRLYAYDAIDENFTLVVADKRLKAVDVGGEVRLGEDQFYADMFVDVMAQVPVRIPSVGPGTRVLVARSEPAMKFEIQRDGADNWFIVGDARRRVRLVMQLAIPRASFGSEFANATWSELARGLPPISNAARSIALDVTRTIGVSQSMRPRDAVTTLVAYFRAFAPSEDLPRASTGPALYQELATSKKGVCRHRAYAFVITALALGVPARLVRNEAHAWVEAFDGVIWHRIDLGGAASNLEYEQTATTHLHKPPEDPYRWPDNSESALATAERALASSQQGMPSAASASPLASAPGRGPSSDPARDRASSDDTRPSSQIVMNADARELRRGNALHVSGQVKADDEACPFSRVDVALRGKNGQEHWLGALATDNHGRYDGRVTIPLSVDVGDYTIVASTPGAGHCAASRQ